MKLLLRSLSSIDWLLLLPAALLFAAGLVTLHSAALGTGYFDRQVAFGIAGLVIMLIAAAVPWKIWKLLALPCYLGLLLLLAAVLLFGSEANNARRWLSFGSLSVQPSELAKLIVPLAVACFYSLFDKRRLWQHFVAALLVLVPAALVFVQPDLGTALMIGAAGALVIFFAGLPLWFMALAALIAASVSPYVWNEVLKDYQKDRIISITDPYQDPLGAGYHTIQSNIAVGSGGMWGKGWEQGSQSQLGFLPERHTDFIFAVHAEEFGFVGSMLLLAIIMIVFLKMAYMAGAARDYAGSLTAAGLCFAFLLQSLINLGMVSGVLPVVGLPLPMISYGGTSLLTLFATFGVMMAIGFHRERRAVL
ncbi:MAG: rod shape-determining protein RodA [Betaproteobacteria bacterium]|nr:rod shape-determining protein RodA [Betaproteobacteria bacterium]